MASRQPPQKPENEPSPQTQRGAAAGPGRLTAAQAAQLFDLLAQAIPEPKTELVYGSPFQLLVAVMLSAQATDVSVNKATATLFKAAPTPQAMLALGAGGILAHIRSIGLAPTKAKNVAESCRLLLERHGGQVPPDRAALEALPGVGRKTASVVLNTAFQRPEIAVDTHILRLANRTGLAPGQTPLEVEKGLLQVTPPRHLLLAHHYLILHGRYTCTARKPRCPACPIRAICRYPDKTVA